MKTVLSVAALALLAAAGAANAADEGTPLPTTYIVHKLEADGIPVRSVEAEDGIYEARVVATDGTIVKVGVDPQTAELTDAYSHARARAAKGTAPKVNAAEAIQAVAYTGFWDVRAVEFEDGAWMVKARDDLGARGRFAVDPMNGTVTRR
jgi:hypothetical protein